MKSFFGYLCSFFGFSSLVTNPGKGAIIYYLPFTKIRDFYKTLEHSAESIGARVLLIENINVEYDVSIPKSLLPSTGFQKNNWEHELLDDYLRSRSMVAKFQDDKNLPVNKKHVVLLNWPDGGKKINQALDWGRSHNLEPADPNTVLSVAEKIQNLPLITGVKNLLIVSMVGIYSFKDSEYCCCVAFAEGGILARVNLREYYDNYHDWFAFVLDPKSLD